MASASVEARRAAKKQAQQQRDREQLAAKKLGTPVTTTVEMIRTAGEEAFKQAQGEQVALPKQIQMALATQKLAMSAGSPVALAKAMTAANANPYVNTAQRIGGTIVGAPTMQNAQQNFVEKHPYVSAAIAGVTGLALGGAAGYAIANRTSGGAMGKRKRVNPTNVKALRKAVARLAAYDRLDRSIDKTVKKALGRRKS